MHNNRSLFTLPEYQNRLIKQSQTLRFFLLHKTDGTQYYYKPSIRSIWVEKFRQNYLKDRSKKLAFRLQRGDLSFVTLTYWTELYSPEQVADRHKSDINRFIKSCRKQYGKISYSYVVEVTKKNYVHFHIFLSKQIPKNFIKKLWKSITGSWRIDKVDITDPRKAANYVRKYVEKMDCGSLSKLEFMWNYIDRFFACSRNFFRSATDPGRQSKFRMLAMFRASEDLTLAIDSECSSGGFLNMENFFTKLSDHNNFIRFTFSESGNLYGYNDWLDTEESHFNYFSAVVNEFDYNLEEMIDTGWHINTDRLEF